MKVDFAWSGFGLDAWHENNIKFMDCIHSLIKYKQRIAGSRLIKFSSLNLSIKVLKVNNNIM